MILSVRNVHWIKRIRSLHQLLFFLSRAFLLTYFHDQHYVSFSLQLFRIVPYSHFQLTQFSSSTLSLLSSTGSTSLRFWLFPIAPNVDSKYPIFYDGIDDFNTQDNLFYRVKRHHYVIYMRKHIDNLIHYLLYFLLIVISQNIIHIFIYICDYEHNFNFNQTMNKIFSSKLHNYFKTIGARLSHFLTLHQFLPANLQYYFKISA